MSCLHRIRINLLFMQLYTKTGTPFLILIAKLKLYSQNKYQLYFTSDVDGSIEKFWTRNRTCYVVFLIDVLGW